MYYSRAKQKTCSALTIVFVFSSAFLWLCFQSQNVQQSLCLYTSAGRIDALCKSSLAETWNLFYHLGGNGPWIPRSPEGDDSLPMNCKVEQAHMISRHAERYPTKNAGSRHIALLQRIQDPALGLKGQLAFVRDWRYFTNLTDPDFENLTATGPYAGTVQATNSGVKLRAKYHHLINPNASTTFWSCDAHRDVETARYFADGFFGRSWEDSANLVVIPETTERGADTLTPGVSCLNYRRDVETGHDQGYAELVKWQRIFAAPIAERLREDAGELSLTPLEIYGMMELCGFEILARGSSPWCSVFSHDEWLDYEYGRDLLHYYRGGPGNKYAPTLGWLWLNATTNLLQDEKADGMYLSFVHDGDIVPLLTTLGILDEARGTRILPSNKRINRRWKTSDVVPMGGRLILERVTCSNTGLGQNLRRSYVRLLINDGIVDLAKSMLGSGLANAVGMKQWVDMVRRRGVEAGDFAEVCGLKADAPQGISFLQPQYRR